MIEVLCLFAAMAFAAFLGYGESAYPVTNSMVAMITAYTTLVVIDAIIRVYFKKSWRGSWYLQEIICWVSLSYVLEKYQNFILQNRLPFTGWLGAVMTVAEFILLLFTCRWALDWLYFLKEKVRKHYEALN